MCVSLTRVLRRSTILETGLPPIRASHRGRVSEATEILRSYVRLMERVSGGGSVSLYVPPGPGEEREVLLHQGRLDPVPELADAERAADLHRRLGSEPADHDEGMTRIASRRTDGL